MMTRTHKLYLWSTGLLALWVGLWGYFAPADVDVAIPWWVPPLHARFLGAIYLSAALLMACGVFRGHSYAEIRVIVRIVVIWTGLLFIISLFYLGEFDFRRSQVWIWFASYLILPLAGLWLMWRDRNSQPLSGHNLPGWVKGYLLAQGVLVTTFGLALLLAPTFMATLWSWRITPLLAHIYSAPFLAYGTSSLMLSRNNTWAEVRFVVIGVLAFALGVLLASFIHRDLFGAANIATVLWFGGFGLVSLALGIITVRGLRLRELST